MTRLLTYQLQILCAKCRQAHVMCWMLKMILTVLNDEVEWWSICTEVGWVLWAILQERLIWLTSKKWIHFFCPQKFTFCPQPIFFPLFLNENDTIWKNRLGELLYRFRQYASLITTVQLESQCLQSYDGLLQNLAWTYQEGLHNLACIETQAKQF